jgi:hypothetical protein
MFDSVHLASLNTNTQTVKLLPYPSAQDLVDGGRLLERALGLHHWPHLLHVEHERVQRLLDVVLVFLVFALE